MSNDNKKHFAILHETIGNDVKLLAKYEIELFNLFGRMKMGEWSDYFDDFPEENPANYLGHQFNPAGAKVQRDAQQKAEQKLQADQQKRDAEIAAIIQKHKTPD